MALEEFREENWRLEDEDRWEAELQLPRWSFCPPDKWQKHEGVRDCFLCGETFGFFYRRKKHTCRGCGNVVCGECSPHTLSFVRVCNECHGSFQAVRAETVIESFVSSEFDLEGDTGVAQSTYTTGTPETSLSRPQRLTVDSLDRDGEEQDAAEREKAQREERQIQRAHFKRGQLHLFIAKSLQEVAPNPTPSNLSNPSSTTPGASPGAGRRFLAPRSTRRLAKLREIPTSPLGMKGRFRASSLDRPSVEQKSVVTTTEVRVSPPQESGLPRTPLRSNSRHVRSPEQNRAHFRRERLHVGINSAFSRLNDQSPSPTPPKNEE